jgi:peptidoglycan/LPS O-acetylase OafA/YrhL
MNSNKARIISGNSSILLDSLRLFAAISVLTLHAQSLWFPINKFSVVQPPDYAHSAVIIFFVLSGFVIAHTTESSNRGRSQYAVARLSRLSSVVIPALVITGIAQFMVGRLDITLLHSFSRGPSVIRYIISGLYLNEVWFFSAAPIINIPLWSLSYEFWYYVIFGFWFFKGTGWKAYILPLLACLVAGPKILLMMPIWLAGVIAYRTKRPILKVRTSWLLVFLFLIIGFLMVAFLPPLPAKAGYKPLFFSSQFITDWITCVFVGLAFWVLPTTGNTKTVHTKKELWFRKVADLTFPIYVMHFPLLILFQALFGLQLHNFFQMVCAFIFAISISSLIGIILDKYRFIWIKLFKKIFGFNRSIFSPQS